MNEGTLRNVGNVDGSWRRRSQRLMSPLRENGKMAAVKRSITVRKIAPRKTVAPSEHDKENTRSGVLQLKEQRASTPGRGGSSSVKKKKEEEKKEEKEKAAVASPSFPTSSPPASTLLRPEDAVWSQKVRRSYSRLDKSLDKSPDCRDNLFGFDELQTPQVVPRVVRSKLGPEVLSGLDSFTLLEEEEDCGGPVLESDLNIPGVEMEEEKRRKRRRRRRRKVQQIGTTELDELAARLNAEFDEAEEFELLVE